MKSLLISMPALNEEQTIGATLDHLKGILRGMNVAGIGDTRILVVDDGSKDETSRIAKERGASVIRHSINQGVGGAFHTAVKEALRSGADILLTIDADGQFDPNDIPKLLDPIMTGRAEFVTGSRFMDRNFLPTGIPRHKHFGNLAMSRLVSTVTGGRFKDVSCGFRAYSRECLLHLNLKGKFTYTQETFIDLVAKQLRIVEVPVTVKYHEGRVSRVAGSILRYAYRTSSIILRTLLDWRPLWLFSQLGVVNLVVSILFGGWVTAHYLKHGAITPYKAFAFASGFFFLLFVWCVSLGVIGQLLSRVRSDLEYLMYLNKKQLYDKKGD